MSEYSKWSGVNLALELTERRGDTEAESRQLGVRGVTEQRHVALAPLPAHLVRVRVTVRVRVGVRVRVRHRLRLRVRVRVRLSLQLTGSSETVDSTTSPSTVASAIERMLAGQLASP